MSKQTRQSSADLYRQRFLDYGRIYSDSWPEPDPNAGGGAVKGSQTSVLKRKERYNDKDTTQTSKVTGV